LESKEPRSIIKVSLRG